MSANKLSQMNTNVRILILLLVPMISSTGKQERLESNSLTIFKLFLPHFPLKPNCSCFTDASAERIPSSDHKKSVIMGLQCYQKSLNISELDSTLTTFQRPNAIMPLCLLQPILACLRQVNLSLLILANISLPQAVKLKKYLIILHA